MSTITVSPAEVRPGDLVTAVDGEQLPRYLTADRKPVIGKHTVTLHFARPRHSNVEWRHYLEPGQRVTVQRPDPTPPTPRTRMVTLHGYRLLSRGGMYFTPDEEYRVGRFGGYTECDNPHPMRLGADAAKDITARPHLYPASAKLAVQQGKRGYTCPGCHEHYYEAWAVDRRDAHGHYREFSSDDRLAAALGNLPATYLA